MNKTCNATVTTREFLNKFWDEVKLVDLSATQNYGNNYRHFAHMANAKNKGFACTYRACDSTNLTVLCIYDKKINSGTIYTAAANPADICKCQNNRNDCVRYLCQYEYKPGELITA
ncbi:hypothetical protein ANCCAN_30609 [Ancylostoma caninum]|uniref:SCP domain-containing protein n=1 Tax=Ancylostoma caninum TaxID=29170 RepID=A0A368EVP0_ANCCA|nr:hypothetical protein ANCCAN_30609 [Ancylostoma caninum]